MGSPDRSTDMSALASVKVKNIAFWTLWKQLPTNTLHDSRTPPTKPGVKLAKGTGKDESSRDAPLVRTGPV